MNVTDRGAQCNRAIMIITDGAPDTYEDIFDKYNWPYKDVSPLARPLSRTCSCSCVFIYSTIGRNVLQCSLRYGFVVRSVSELNCQVIRNYWQSVSRDDVDKARIL